MADSKGCQPIVVVGVLCIDVALKLQQNFDELRVKSYIAASYVKWLEGAGAQVVPIWIGKPREYYVDIMQKINGILIPGGAVFFNAKYITSPALESNDCVQSSQFIYEIARAKNAIGEFFPIWGTCLGMELLLLHSAEGVDPRQDCQPMDNALPVTFAEDFRHSRLFKSLSTDMEQTMQTVPFGYHFHRYCITENDLFQFKICNEWHVLATNKDLNGLEFISIMEHKIYPFYGTQFHPEKVRYEQCNASDKGCHTSNAIVAAQYLSDFFVSECRKSSNRFEQPQELLSCVIWNYEVTWTASCTRWMQCYLFGERINNK